MDSLRQALCSMALITVMGLLAACGGGGNNGASPVANENSAASNNTSEGSRMLSFADDIKPIMQGKCLGCYLVCELDNASVTET